MVTSFFGSESFGGDAVYVERLSRALLRAGHEVEVAHSPSAYRAVRGSHPGRPFATPSGLRVHRIESRAGRLAAVWTHQTGRLGPAGEQLRAIIDRGRFDAIHLHNVSLLGGTELIELAGASGAVTLLAAHDHWQVCPLSTLWRPQGELCERPRCVRCAVRSGRPPQLWRRGERMARAIDRVSAVVYPSEHTRRLHAARGVGARAVVMPYFLPEQSPPVESGGWARRGRPYVAAAGRLVEEKGFGELISAWEGLPGVDLVLAGAGPDDERLQEQAGAAANVRFVGLLDEAEIGGLFDGATAVVVPSRFWETFGYVVAEAAAVGTPTIVRDRGPLADHARQLGSPTFDDASGLRDAVRRLIADPDRRERLGSTARRRAAELWSESGHVAAYEALIERLGEPPGARRGELALSH